MIRKEGKEGNATRTCLQSGQWSGNPIKCTGTICKQDIESFVTISNICNCNVTLNVQNLRDI